ncbi:MULTISPECIES: hypothetical protein [unclassified Microcoleus]|nr:MULTISPECIES: hypothetical protein [unclassified Microcoleus]
MVFTLDLLAWCMVRDRRISIDSTNFLSVKLSIELLNYLQNQTAFAR